jgi:7-cyano-7-deazaguanine synthase
MSKAVVLLSGGIDSATVLAMALEENDEVLAVSFNYGSNHNAVERTAAERIVEWYVVGGHELVLREVELPPVFGGGKSALFSEIPMPEMSYKEIAENVGPSPTVVPFRNANLISLATTLAVVHDAQLVYAGMHAEDARGFAYPDCTAMFLGPMAACVYVGTYHKVQFKVPFQWLMKRDIVERAYALGVPAHLTWSCYRPVTAPETQGGGAYHCGKCPTCVERIEAFKANNLIDPVAYAPGINIDWAECDPYELDAE